MHKTVGVFDSGIGGLSLANAIQLALPDVNVIFKNDSANVPYGTKSKNRLFKLALPLLQDLAEKSDILVIACNTLTTNLLFEFQDEIDVPIIGVEPLLGEAANSTKSGVICVCATPRTLKSERYQQLKDLYTSDIKVFEPNCSGWSDMIERYDVDSQKVSEIISTACEQNADVIVLGCTHYHWIAEEISRTAHKYSAQVLFPQNQIVELVKQELKLLQ